MRAGRQACLAILVCLPAGFSARAGDAQQVVVIANANVTGSLEVANHYLQARGIPSNHLFVADLPARESMSRYVYESRLRDPLLAFLRERGLAEQVQRAEDTVRAHESGWTTVRASVRYLVSAYGVPLRIVDTKPLPVAKVANWVDGPGLRDSAAVDSELSLLLHAPYDIQGSVRNPLYAALRYDDLGDKTFEVLMACRLDGPDVATAKRLVDDAAWAEENGLCGRGYFDTMATSGGGYALGDQWIAEACERFRREGLECVLDRADPVWGAAFPMEDAAVYMGWYNEQAVGPFLRDGFRFSRGAIAYHLHSTSAKTLRSGEVYWAGPLLARGAAVTMGAVDEPYLGLTIDLDRFAGRLCSGSTVGESWYLSMQALSWQMTLVGDPLYRPFGRSLETLVAAPAGTDAELLQWAWLRRVNVLVREGRLEAAFEYAHAKLAGCDGLALRERLAELYALNGRMDAAAEQYEIVVDRALTAETAARAGAKYLALLRRHNRMERAAEVEGALRARWAGSASLGLLGAGN